MGMTPEQIEQAKRSLHGQDDIVDGEFTEAVETPAAPAAPARPDSPNAFLTLLIAPVAGYLVAFTATTWFDIGLAGLLVLAVVVVLLLARRFFAGLAGVLALVLFAGVAGAYHLQEIPAIADYVAPHIAKIDRGYLCKAVVCQRDGAATDDAMAGRLAGTEPSDPATGDTAGQPAASEAEPATIRASQEAERQAEQQRVAAALERQRLAEEQRLAEAQRQRRLEEERRLAEEQRRKREAEEQKDRNYRAAISSFEFPSSNCRRPAVPSTDASDYVLDRFDDATAAYSDCVSDAISRDERAVARLVAQLDGTFESLSDGYEVNVWQRFSDPLQHIVDNLVDRIERRVDRHNELADAVDRRNERVSREEYWAGIQESVDRFEYEMERQRQRNWETWNNNNVYVSPGYH